MVSSFQTDTVTFWCAVYTSDLCGGTQSLLICPWRSPGLPLWPRCSDFWEQATDRDNRRHKGSRAESRSAPLAIAFHFRPSLFFLQSTHVSRRLMDIDRRSNPPTVSVAVCETARGAPRSFSTRHKSAPRLDSSGGKQRLSCVEACVRPWRPNMRTQCGAAGHARVLRNAIEPSAVLIFGSLLSCRTRGH